MSLLRRFLPMACAALVGACSSTFLPEAPAAVSRADRLDPALPPVRVADLRRTFRTWNRAPLGAKAAVRVGDKLLAITASPEAGAWTLLHVDGTPAGEVLLAAPALVDELGRLGGHAYFVARVPGDPTQATLWRTDGSVAGTQPVRALPAGNPVAPAFAVLGAQLHFLHAGALWRSDGTEAGTVPVAGEAPPFSALVVRAGRLYLTASDKSLWSSDGASAPVRLGGAASAPVQVGTHVAFVTDGNTLWWTDGTAAGTRLVRTFELVPLPCSPPSSHCFPLTNTLLLYADVGGQLIFSHQSAEHGRELWRSDGTAEGTLLVVDLVPGPGSSKLLALDPEEPFAHAGALYFQHDDGALWRTAGTAQSTAAVMPLSGRSWVVPPVEGWLLLLGRDGVLVRSDFTAQGTTPIAGSPASVTGCRALDGTVLCAEGTGGLWQVDPAAGTARLVGHAFGPSDSASPQSLAALGDTLLFTADGENGGRELWRTGGHCQSTRRVVDLEPGLASASLSELTGWKGAAYFVLGRLGRPDRLMRTDGTAEGTVDLGFLPGHPFLDILTTRAWGERLVVQVYGPDAVAGLWTYAGVPGSFERLSLPEGDIRQLVWRDGHVLVLYWNRLLVRSDGTPAGTVSVALPSGMVPQWVGELGSTLLVYGSMGDGPALWVLGGAAPVRLLGPSGRTSNPVPQAFTEVGGRAFFTFDEGLWVTDGTEAGTRRLVDHKWTDCALEPGDCEPTLYAFGTGVAFKGWDAAHGFEPWVSDGTPEGTRRIADLRAGPADSMPRELRVLGGRLYFAARGDDGSVEPWVSDGTPEGTLQLEVAPGAYNASPTGFTATADGRVYFAAYDRAGGRELWTLGAPSGEAPPVAPLACPADVTRQSYSAWPEPAGTPPGSVSVHWSVEGDACRATTVTSSVASGTVFSVGEYPVTVTERGDDGATRTCSFQVRVTPDTTPPQVACPAPTSRTTASAVGLAWPDAFSATATDTDAALVTAYSRGKYEPFPIGTTTVEFRATDRAGNTATCTFDVTLVHDAAPPPPPPAPTPEPVPPAVPAPERSGGCATTQHPGLAPLLLSVAWGLAAARRRRHVPASPARG